MGGGRKTAWAGPVTHARGAAGAGHRGIVLKVRRADLSVTSVRPMERSMWGCVSNSEGALSDACVYESLCMCDWTLVHHTSLACVICHGAGLHMCEEHIYLHLCV